MYRKLVQESQCSLKFNFCFPIQYILATRKIKHARISFSVILFGEDDFLQRKRNRQTELISIFPLPLFLRYFSFLFYILHKLISLAILVLRQFCRHGRLPQKETPQVGPSTTKSNHSTLSIFSRKLATKFVCVRTYLSMESKYSLYKKLFLNFGRGIEIANCRWI